MKKHHKPFGLETCEQEIKKFGAEHFERLYYRYSPFNLKSLEEETYLIVGRRGSGKTALSQYFSFQNEIAESTAIDVDEPREYQEIFRKAATITASPNEVKIPLLAKAWELGIWLIIFRALQHTDHRIRAACLFAGDQGKAGKFVLAFFRALIEKWAGSKDDGLGEELQSYLSNHTIEAAKESVLEQALHRPIIISIDTLENYTVHDADVMASTAALIECASNFNLIYSDKGIHVKVFVMAEIFPRVREETITNTEKFIRDEVFLHWNSRGLGRLICWRYWVFLSQNSLTEIQENDVDWDNWQSIEEKIWKPAFGQSLDNGKQLFEYSFPYVLRHTQFRPRQLIELCNSIAALSIEEGTFPKFTPSQIRSGIKRKESSLAAEIINSYKEVYPGVGNILDNLQGVPILFKGSMLDKIAYQTASQWPDGQYSPYNFRQLVAELGIVGKVRSHSHSDRFVEADFEYVMTDRLKIGPNDDCVIHPMFFEKFGVNMDNYVRVYPLPVTRTIR